MKRSVNILLIVVLAALIGGLGFFSYKLIFQKDKILVPDFSNATYSEINTWCNNLETNPCSFEYEYSDTVAKDGLIYQSLSADTELSDSITFIISAGKQIEIKLPEITADSTKDLIAKWISENNIKNPVEYVEEYSNKVEENYVIRYETSVITDEAQTIKVYVSKGHKPSTEDGIVVETEKYLDLTEDAFKTKAKELKLTPNHNTERDDYSENIEKGKIVWHGSGTYEENETINYGLSLGKNADAIVIKKGEYVGKTLTEFEEAIKKLGLVAEHYDTDTYHDETSETIEKGSLDWHGSGTYAKGETIHYTLSLGKSGEKKSKPVDFKQNQFQGKTLAEFTAEVSVYDLKPEHNTSWDDYSATIAKGNIIRHGYGTYEKNETTIRYGLSLGKSTEKKSKPVEFKENQFQGKTLAEFTAAVEVYDLKPEHNSGWDKYSSTIAKGNIIRHGFGTYYEDETTIRYGLSLGPETQVEKVTVASGHSSDSESAFKSYISGLGLVPSNGGSDYSTSVAAGGIIYSTGSYNKGSTFTYYISLGIDTRINVTSHANESETDFLSYLSSKGLVAGTRTEQTSSSVRIGKIITNTTGTFDAGSSISYTVSKGLRINNFNTVAASEQTSFDGTKSAIAFNFDGFTNVTYVGAKGESIGKLLEIKVNGQTNNLPGDFNFDDPIVVTICDQILN